MPTLARRVLEAVCAIVFTAVGATSQSASPVANVKYPWVFQSDVSKRIDDSPIVVSGTIKSTKRSRHIRVDGLEVMRNDASIDVDRVFKGRIQPGMHGFLWYSPSDSRVGVAYSGPPISSFKP